MATDKAYNNALIQIQKLANTSAEKIQKMVSSSNQLQMKYNKQEAEAARAWQKNMSETSHQMEVKDLKKAGLNPVLSVNSGAQSYTTSSASTDNDSGASAASGILGSQLGALSSMESSRMTSEAQVKASAQQARAMKYAAETSAKAQRDAAALSAAASNYAADKHLEGIKARAEADKWISVNKQASGVFGLIDKMSRKTGLQGGVVRTLKSAFKFAEPKLSALVKNPDKYFSNKSGKINLNNFKLNSDGKKFFNNISDSLGLRRNQTNQKLIVQAFVFRDQSAMDRLGKRVEYRRQQRIASYHHGYSPTTVQRSGHR